MECKEYLYNVIINNERGIIPLLIRTFFLVLSFIYFLLVKGFSFLCASGIISSYISDKKIISVGNITVGGTGKTPFELYLVETFFQERKVAIISGGYNEDELNLLQYKLPQVKILSGKNRINLIRRAQSLFDLDIIILDDGFQQWRIKKDIEIVLIDASNPFSNGRLLPAGLLREPLSSLKRADIFVLTKVAESMQDLGLIKAKIQEINKKAVIFECNHRAVGVYEPIDKKDLLLESLRGRRIFTFSAIGSSESFRRTLEHLDVNIVGSKDYLDHHKYVKTDIDNIINAASDSQAEIIITTEKDWMRLDANMVWKLSNNQKFYLLKIAIEPITEQKILNEELSKLFPN